MRIGLEGTREGKEVNWMIILRSYRTFFIQVFYISKGTTIKKSKHKRIVAETREVENEMDRVLDRGVGRILLRLD